MQKVVINTCFGGFSLSEEATQRLNDLTGNKYSCYCGDMERDNKYLIQTVQEFGDNANGEDAKLKIVQIPDDVLWEVEEYDGNEWIAENSSDVELKHEIYGQ